MLVLAAAATAVLVGLRAAAPWLVESYLNDELAELGEYTGSVEDVDLALLRGGYTLHNLRLIKANGGASTPFAEVPTTDLSLQWRALFDGRVVGEILMQSPRLNFLHSEDESARQFGAGVNWPEAVRNLFPFRSTSCGPRTAS